MKSTDLLKKTSKIFKGAIKLWPLVLMNFLPIVGYLIYKEVTNPAPTFKLAPENSSYIYEATNNIYKVNIGAKKGGKPEIRFENANGESISFTFLSKTETENKLVSEGTRSLVFQNIDENIDVEYQTLENGVKEWIVINEKVDRDFFVFEVEGKDLEARQNYRNLQAPGFLNEEGDYAFNIEKGYAIDALGNRTEEVHIQYVDKEEQDYLKVDVDPEWLNDETRRYPIRIDPTIVYDETSEFAAGQFNRGLDTGSGSSPSLETYYQELPNDRHTAGLWHLNNDWTDSSGNGNDGTAEGAATFTTSARTGSHAGSFDGTDDNAVITDSASLSISGPNITLMTWAYLNSGETTASLIHKGGHYTLTVVGNQLTYADSVNYSYANNGYYGTVPTEKWVHLAVTFNGESRDHYIDGEHVGSQTAYTGNLTDNSVNLLLGCYNDAGVGGISCDDNYSLDGRMDEAAVYSRSLTPEEIKSAASRRPYSVYTSDVIDATNNVSTWNPFTWTELGVSTGDGETVYDDTDLVAQWNFNETSGTTANNDAEGSSCGGTPGNCDGTLTGFDSTASQDADPDSSWTANNRRWGAGALQFDGTDSIVTVTQNSSINFNQSDSFSVEAWINTIVNNVGNVIINKQQNVTNEFGYTLNITSSGEANFSVFKQNVLASNATSPPLLEADEWYHLVGTSDGSNVKIYVNGVLHDTESIGFSSATQSLANLYLGQQYNSAAFWDGIIDSTRIYSRTLTSSEILSNYNSSNIEFQTRVGADTSPHDGSWDDWLPTTSETQIDDLDINKPESRVFELSVDDYNTNQNWQKIDNSIPSASNTTGTNGRLPLGVGGSGDDSHIYGLATIKDEDTYKMWYGGHDGSNVRIFYASSPDGLTWTKQNNAADSVCDTTCGGGGRLGLGTNATGDDTHLLYSTVIKDGSTYKMWYSGYDGSNYRIYYATSPDGLTWTKYDNSVPANSDTTSTNGRIPLGTNGTGDDNRAFNPMVIKDGTTYKMWYSGDDGSNVRIYYATSPDGLTWTKLNNTADTTCDNTCGGDGRLGLGTNTTGDDTHAYFPTIIKDGNVYKMWYTGADGTSYYAYYAISYDGLTWTKQNNAVPPVSNLNTTDGRISLGSNGTGDDVQSFGITAIKDSDGNYKAWYAGYDSANYRVYGATMAPLPFAQSTDTDILIEGTGSEKLELGRIQVDGNTLALWHLDETNGDNAGDDIFDATSNNKDGEFNGSNLATAVVDGISGKARSFNGTDDYISISDTTDPTAYTIEAWVKPDDVTNGASILVRTDSSGPTTSWSHELKISSSGNFQHYVYDGAAQVVTGTTTVTPGQWYHVVGTAINSGSVRLYVNGKEEGTADTLGNMWIGGDRWHIGASSGDDIFYEQLDFYDGVIDEVRIKNVAMNPEEIAETYRLGGDHYLNKTLATTDLTVKKQLPFYIAADRPGTYLETIIGETEYVNGQTDESTNGLWRFDEQSDNVCDNGNSDTCDSSGNGNHGDLTGAPATTQGKVGKGRKFDGTTDYITLNNSSTLSPGANNFTLETWMRTNQSYPFGTNTNGWIYGDYGADTDNVIAIRVMSGDVANCFARDGDGDSASADGTSNITDGKWHHLACVRDGTTVHTYVDGILENSTTNALLGTISVADGNPPIIGKYTQTADEYYSGDLDELRYSSTNRPTSDIRQTYEKEMRASSITIDFAADLDSVDLIADSNDLSFEIDATAYGLDQQGSQVFLGDKIIVRETIDDTEYIAQGTVSSTNISTGAISVSSWDSGGTFPSGGFTANATVFKWQREYFDLSGVTLDEQMDAITQLTLRITDGSEGRTVWLDDFKSSGDYLTDPSGSTVTSATGNRYVQYRAILSSSDEKVSSQLTSTTLDYIINTVPDTPSLDSPTDRSKTLLAPVLTTTSNDGQLDDLQYRIVLCKNASMTYSCQTFDQTSSQTGWSGQDAQTGTMYASGTQATYTIQSDLDAGTTYYWKSYAIDPNGFNGWSATQSTPYVFHTNSHPRSPSADNYDHFIARRENNQNAITSGWSSITGAAETGTTASTNGWIDSTNLTPGEQYLIMVWGEHNADSTSATSGMRVKHGSTSFTESQTIEKTTNSSTSHKTPYAWFTVWTAVAGEDLEAEMYWGGEAGAQARVEDVTLIALNAEDLLANNDLKYDIDTVGGALTSSFAAAPTLTWTPTNDSDAWWIMSYSQADIEDNTSSITYESRLNINSTPYSTQQINGNAQFLGDTPVYSTETALTLPNSSNTVSLELRESAADQSWNSAGLFALRLDSFRNFFFDSSTSSGPTMDTPFAWIEQLNYDPTIQLQNNWLISSGGLVQDDGAQVVSRLQNANLNITDDVGGWTKGTNQPLGTNLADVYTSWTAGLQNVDFDAQTTLAGTANILDGWLVGFSFERYTTATGPRPDLPTNGATNQSLTPQLKTAAIDADGDLLKYKIDICDDLAMTLNCQTFSQTASQTGWSGQDASSGSRYQSGTQATYTIQSDLDINSTYYWRSYAIDEATLNVFSAPGEVFSFTTTNTPTAPTALETEGSTNPTDVADATPEFTAIHNDPDGDSANFYRIQVNSESDFGAGTMMWNPGKESMTTTADGNRSPEISYAGNSLDTGVTYYWRILFWDVNGAEGVWSETGTFELLGLVSPSGCYLEESDDDASITLHWNDTNSIEDGYRVQRSVNGGAFSTLIDKAANSTSHADSTISQGSTYQYRVAGKLVSVLSDYCTTTTADVNQGSIEFEGLQLDGLQIN